MAIKVVINYPTTEEGMRLFQEKQAEAALKFLMEELPKKQLDLVMQRLIELNSKEKQA